MSQALTGAAIRNAKPAAKPLSGLLRFHCDGIFDGMLDL